MSITSVLNTLLLHGAPQKLKNIIAAKQLSASLTIDMLKKGEVETFLAEYAEGQYLTPPEPEPTPTVPTPVTPDSNLTPTTPSTTNSPEQEGE